MNRFWTFLLDVRVLSVLGLAALAAFLFIGADALQIALFWAGLVLAVVLLAWGTSWLVRKILARRAAHQLETALDDDAKASRNAAPAKDKAEVQALRGRLHEAVKTIKTSKLGQTSGSAALYELPWYMIIGNPAAGKSTAVVKSGLKFPFADNTGNIIKGIGGTRNCDWFFTSDGILLDTAGRYSVHEEDRPEWLGFLALLKKHRSKAPINGIIIAASVAELATAKPEQSIQLAKSLRQRVQELTEKLEVFAPVYVMFTKADLVSGFVEFFEDRDRAERDGVWGATLPYDPADKADAVDLFDRHFDELRDGLKEVATARLSLHRGQKLPPGVLTFPLEFAALKPALRAFIATLFEENPYQFRPIFRGFYFTSAAQEGSASSRAREQVAQAFALNSRPEHTTANVVAENGFFLRDLFTRVIFGDRNLVRQYASRTKMRARAATFALAVAVLALALGGWTWSYLGNRQLMASVQKDLDLAVKLQADRLDLGSRVQAMEVLQNRIEQLAQWRTSRPLAVSLGLYQGETLERKLREEYFHGLRQLMLQPVTQAIEGYLAEVNQNAGALQPMARLPESGAAPLGPSSAASAPGGMKAVVAPAVPSRFVEASATSVEDAYNALKTYLMLAERPRMEPGHLTDQITRFWRGWLDSNRGTMPREELIRSAERMIGYAMANLQDPAYPILDNNLGLVDQTRESLRRVVRGMPARERVYSEVKARASTRFAPMTVNRIVGDTGRQTVLGSYAISGTFTREAWDEYIEEAFKQAATGELQSVDWVLKTSARDDLSLAGSPDQIRKGLTELYKTEYVREWQRFLQGVNIVEFGSFESAVMHMNRLGDTADSPIKRLLTTLFDQTSWDNPSLLNDRLAKTQQGMVEWIKQSILRQAPSRVEVKVDVAGPNAAIPMGPIGREFAALSRVMMSRDSNPPLMAGYLKVLGNVRSRFNTIKLEGDAGPSSRQLMSATLDGSNSELAEALKFVDEQMLLGMTDSARAALRPLLVRPLMQSFAVLVAPVETAINRDWAALVYDPFQRTLAAKFPFVTSQVEASPQEIAKIFGPEGSIAKFATDGLGRLVVRDGATIKARTWADMGVRLRPEFTASFPNWVATLEGAAAVAAGGASGGSTAAAGPGARAAIDPSQTAFQILPQGSPGLIEYTVTIDGQSLRYRNTAPVWTDFVWPNPSAVPGVTITGVSLDGKAVEVLNVPGRFGLERMFELAQRQKLADGTNVLSWGQGNQSVALHLRIIRAPGMASGPAATAGGAPATAGAAAAAAPAATGLRGLKLPALAAGADAPVTPRQAPRRSLRLPTPRRAPLEPPDEPGAGGSVGVWQGALAWRLRAQRAPRRPDADAGQLGHPGRRADVARCALEDHLRPGGAAALCVPGHVAAPGARRAPAAECRLCRPPLPLDCRRHLRSGGAAGIHGAESAGAGALVVQLRKGRLAPAQRPRRQPSVGRTPATARQCGGCAGRVRSELRRLPGDAHRRLPASAARRA